MNSPASIARRSETESSILEYARYYNLTSDYLCPSIISEYIHRAQLEPSESSKVVPSDSHLPQFPPSTHISTQERFQCSKEVAELLFSLQRTDSPTSDFLTPARLDVRVTKRLKCELPLLLTDHEADLWEWLSNRRDELEPDDVVLPMEPLNDEKGESLRWPSKMWDLPEQVMREIRGEKTLDVTHEDIEYLQDIMKDEDVEDISLWNWDGVDFYKRSKALEPMSPPLLCIAVPYVPYIPSSPVLHLPLFPSSYSNLSEEAREAEEAIFKDDQLTPPLFGFGGEDGDMDLDFDLLDEIFGKDSSPTFTRAQAKDLKIEEPLTPLTLTRKSVSFHDMIEINTYMDELRSNTSLSNLASSHAESELNISEEIETLAGSAAANVEQALGKEQLIAADSTQRVPVPQLDFSLPPPPWKCGSDTRDVSKKLRILVDEALEQNPITAKWAGISKLNNKLRWEPFAARLAKVSLNERLEHNGAIDNYLKERENEKVATSSYLTWKPKGLRILKEDGIEEEDLDLGIFPDMDTVNALKSDTKNEVLSSLIRKRKLAFTKKMATKPLSKSRKGADGRKIQVGSVFPNHPSEIIAGPQEEPSDLLLTGLFSAASAINNFRELRGGDKAKLKKSTYFEDFPPERNIPIPHKPVSKPVSKPVLKLDPEPAQIPLPLPVLLPSQTPNSLILSTAIFQDKSLKTLPRDICNLSPQAVLIERDFSRHNSAAWLLNTPTIQRSPIISPLDSEADIIISASTGILLTTLQKITQRPLPGRKEKNKVWTRIQSICPRYERLLVLITGDSVDDDRNKILDEKQCTALVDLTAFTSSLSAISTIIQHYIPTRPSLTGYIVSLISTYGTHQLHTALLNEETHWELFLRRAGCNAFMAQVIIMAMKPPDGVDLDRDEEGGAKRGIFGLTAFVEMDARERTDRFGGVCGGTRVLRRVGMVLDGAWT